MFNKYSHVTILQSLFVPINIDGAVDAASGRCIMHTKKFGITLKSVKRFLELGANLNIIRILEQSHPADIAHLFRHLSTEEKKKLFRIVRSGESLAAQVLSEMGEDHWAELVADLDSQEASEIVQEMESDDAADLLAIFEEEKAREIIHLMQVDGLYGELRDAVQIVVHDPCSRGICRHEILAGRNG